MKIQVLILAVGCLTLNGNAQTSTISAPEKVTDVKMSITSNANSDLYQLSLSQEQLKEYLVDPLTFLERKFDIDKLLDHTKGRKYSQYNVVLESKSGSVNAIFSRDGTLLRMSHRLTDQRVPIEIGREIYKKYGGWTMVKSKYLHSINDPSSKSKEVYQIRLQKGDQRKKVTFISTDDPEVRYVEVQGGQSDWNIT